MPASQRLKKGDITLQQVYLLSRQYYQNNTVDDKKRRARIDIISGKITQRNNLTYNRSTRRWEQTGQESKITFIVSSNPKSYKSEDTVKIHRYPVVFLFKDISKGIASPFRWRTGSQKSPIFPKKGVKKEKRIKAVNQNIKNQIQLQFFFHLEFVSKMYGTLFGRCRAKWPPKKTNPKMLLYFDKTAYFCVEKVLIPLLSTGKGLQVGKPVKNN